jgi:peptide/nickel transport system permease protein
VIWRSPAIIFGLVIVAVLLVVSICAPYISPYSPSSIDLLNRVLPPFWMEGGSKAHLLGTDHLGRDVLSWLIWGTRTSFLLSALLVLISAVTGTILGIVSGYLGGKVDAALMRVVDFTMAFPIILLALMLYVMLGPGILTIFLIVSLHLWAGFARMARGETLRVKNSDFIDAAKVMGVSKPKIMLRHLLPNAMTPLVILATLNIGRTVVFVSTLSFLGIGIPVTVADWGNLINNGRLYLDTGWWIAIFPSLCIAVVVLVFNMLGDKLNEYINPELRFKMHAR